MQFSVTGKDIPLTRPLKDYIDKRLERVRRHVPGILSVAVILSVEGTDHVVRINLKTSFSKLSVSGKSADMYSSIDNAISKLERASRRAKERNVQKPRVKANRAKRKKLVNPKDENLDILKVSEFEMCPMSVDEALLQMKVLEFNFYMFRDSEDSGIKVVYKRNDRTYGLIEPEI